MCINYTSNLLVYSLLLNMINLYTTHILISRGGQLFYLVLVNFLFIPGVVILW